MAGAVAFFFGTAAYAVALLTSVDGIGFVGQ